MPLTSAAFTQQKLCVDFAAVKTCSPEGVYVAPLPDEPLIWTGVLFVRKGPYAKAILRFQIRYPVDYPQRPPIVTFQSDLFHPLVSPLTTYTHSTRDFGADTQSATDEHRLPPGGLSLRHAFPDWFQPESNVVTDIAASQTGPAVVTDAIEQQQSPLLKHAPRDQRAPHIVEVLQYIRIAFDTEELLDAIPLDAAANTSAWHAWKSYRLKITPSRGITSPLGDHSRMVKDRSASPRQQPGGARRPGEWNWQGVWEERVRRCVQASVSEAVLYGGDNTDVISFLRMDEEAISQVSPLQRTEPAP